MPSGARRNRRLRTWQPADCGDVTVHIAIGAGIGECHQRGGTAERLPFREGEVFRQRADRDVVERPLPVRDIHVAHHAGLDGTVGINVVNIDRERVPTRFRVSVCGEHAKPISVGTNHRRRRESLIIPADDRREIVRHRVGTPKRRYQSVVRLILHDAPRNRLQVEYARSQHLPWLESFQQELSIVRSTRVANAPLQCALREHVMTRGQQLTHVVLLGAMLRHSAAMFNAR